MNKKKIIVILLIVIILIITSIFGIKFLNKKNKAEEKKENEPYVLKTETVKSTVVYDYNFFLKSPCVVEVTYTADDSCGGLEKLNGMCDNNSKFEFKGVIEGESTIWIVQDRDLSKSTKDNTTVYKVIVDKDLNVTLEEIPYIPIETLED